MTNDEGRIGFSVEIDTAKTQQQIADLQKNFDQMATHVEADGARIDSVVGKSLGNSMQVGANSVDALKQKLQELNQTLAEQKARVAEQKSYVQQSALALAEAKSAYEAVKQAKGDYAASLSEEGEELKAVKKAHEEDTLVLKGYNLEVSKTKLEIAETAAQLKQTGAGNSKTADAFQQIIDKIETWKAKLQDVQVLNNKFSAQNAAVQSLSQSISGLSKNSADYSAKAQSLLGELNQLSAELRLSDFKPEEKAAKVEYLKQKISEYGQAVTQSSATAQTAFSLQQQVVQSLEQTIASLQTEMQAAAAAGNSQAVAAIQQQIDGLNKELVEAKGNLSSLQQQAQSSTQAMEGVASVQEKLSQGTTRGRSFFGDIIDEANLIKGKVSSAFESLSNSVRAKLEPIKTKFQEVGQSVSTSFSNLSQRIGFDRLGEALSSAGNKLSEYKQKVVDAATGHGKFQQSLGNMKTALNGLPIPLGNVLTSIGGVTKALWSMCATPVGAVIAAIVVGLRAMYTWFTKSAEGQKAFTALSAYFGSIMSSITDIVVIFGSYLYHAFADANGPLNAFGKAVVTTFKSAIKTVSKLVGGLGDTLKGIFTLDWDTFKQGVSEMGEGLNAAVETALNAVDAQIKAVTGSVKMLYNAATDDKLGKDLSTAFNGMIDKASQAKDVAMQELNANIALGKAKEKEAAMEGTIAEEMNKIYKLTGKAKEEQIAKVKALKEEKYKDIISAQKQLYEAQQNRNKLHTVSLEDLKKERDLHITLLTTQAQRVSSLRMLTRMEAMNERKMENSANSAANKATTQANAQTAASSKESELVRKNTAARIKAAQELEEAVTDARINAMRDGEAKVIAERNRETQKELAQNEAKKLAAIEAERKRQKEEFEASEAVKKASSKGYKVQAWDDSMLDNTFIASIEEQYKKIEEFIIQKANQVELTAQAEAMRDYLKNYGTYQQQKLAIAEEYAQKIKEVNESADNEATKQWKIKSLEAERDSAVQQKEIEAIKQRVDWGSVFGEFGAMFKDQLKPTIDQLKAIASSKEFKSSSLEEQKTLYELINKLERSNTVWDSDIFKKVADDLTAYQAALKNYTAAQEKERKATEALAAAKERLRKAEANGTTDNEEYDMAKAEVARAEANLAQCSEQVKDFGTQVTETSSDLQSSSQQAVNQINQLKEAFAGLTSGTLAGVAKAFTSFDKLFGKGKLEGELADTLVQGLQSLFGKNSKVSQSLASALGDSGIAGDIISSILGTLDIIAQNGLSGIFTSLQDTIFGSVESILDDVLSGDIITKTFENLGSHLMKIGDTLTFGGLSSWVNGDSDKTLHDDLAHLAQTNEELEKVMENLKETMEDAKIVDSKNVYELEKANIEARMKNTKESMYRSADASSSGFLGIGSKHSTMYEVNKGMDAERWARVSKAAGVAVNSAQDFFNLTSEQMYNVSQYATEDFIILKDLANDGMEDASQFMETYIGYWKELKEAEDSYYEHLTSVSFDSIESEFLSSLTDMDSDAQDFADNFEEYLRTAIMQAMIVDEFKSELQSWYKEFGKALEDGNMSDEEFDRLQREYQENIVNPALEKREALKKMFDWESTSSDGQDSTTISSSGLAEDTGKAIEGRFTAMQIATEGIRSSVAMIQADTKVLSVSADTIRMQTMEIRNISLLAVDHLENIAKNTHELYEMNERLGKIEQNTRNI